MALRFVETVPMAGHAVPVSGLGQGEAAASTFLPMLAPFFQSSSGTSALTSTQMFSARLAATEAARREAEARTTRTRALAVVGVGVATAVGLWLVFGRG